MPIIAGAKKKLRQDIKRAEQNRLIETAFKKVLRDARKYPKPELLQKAYSALDMAAKKHVIHKNKANRLKSRLAKRLPQKSKEQSKK